MPTKKELETKKELARFYYIQGESQKIIAEKVGVSEATLSKWVNQNGWEAKRAGAKVTRPELVNKILLRINNLLDNTADEKSDFGNLTDQLSKAAAAIEKLDKKTNVVDVIDVFMAYDKWLHFRAQYDNELTTEFLKKVNKYEDMYVTEQVSANDRT